MENSDEVLNEKMMEEHLLNSPRKGGFRTMPFVLANEAFERLASHGLWPNMILYLMQQYHMGMASGSRTLFLWSAATNFMPVLGGIVADSFLSRFWMIGFGSIVSLLGMILLLLTTLIPQARPPECTESNSHCSSATIFQLFLLCASFGLISIGAGGIRSSSLAFGADQLKNIGPHINAGFLQRYCSWYYASFTFSVFIASTLIVYIQENMGWKVGFGVPVMLMFISALSFFLASPFYVKLNARSNLIMGLLQVIGASYRKRHVKLSSSITNMYHYKNDSLLLLPSENLRFLNKACIIIDTRQELATDGRATDPWSLCTVDQVEELKSLLKVIPLWSTGMIMSINTSQISFLVLQASSMNRNIGSRFKIPAGSFSTFSTICILLWVALYDRVILPIASRIMGKPAHLSPRQRMGIGIFLSCLSMIITAVVESIRRNNAIREGYLDDPEAVVSLSAIWLIPQYCLFGLAEGFNAIAQNEFYYSEFPQSMSSIASTLSALGVSVANLLASLITSTVDILTKKGGKESWISSNINKGHYDYYYWFLVCLSMINMIYFLICSQAYGPLKGGREEVPEDEVK